MQIIYTPNHSDHNPANEILDGRVTAYYERPERAEIIRRALEREGFGPTIPPRAFGDEHLHAVHDQSYLAYLVNAYERWIAAGGAPAGVVPSTLPVRSLRYPSPDVRAQAGYYCFDLSAPIVAGTYHAARAAAEAALTGAALLHEGQHSAYALCRPPGHHAARDLCGGYCFLNNAAIAAHYLAMVDDGQWTVDGGSSASPSPGHRPPAHWAMRPTSVAVLDIDFHHGNGTQDIFYSRSDVFFVSLHGDPAREYPYFLGYSSEHGEDEGEGYNLNLPLPAGTDDSTYLTALIGALEEIAAYSPRYLVVSAGFDTFGGDPLGDFALTSAAYPVIGAQIAALGLPTLFVQEGGYAIAALGENVASLLRGFAQSV